MKYRGNLNARDDAYVPKIYSEKLDELIADPEIKNIAVTAPYDSGKTTILRSYFKKRENNYKIWVRCRNYWISWINGLKRRLFFSPNFISPIRNYEFINIPNFFEVSSNKCKKDNDNQESSKTEIQLERSIIEQLLYKTNTSKYPDSNLSRLKTHSLFSISVNFTYFIFVFSYLVRILGNRSKLIWWDSLPFWNNKPFQVISFIIILAGSLKLFSSLTHIFSKFKLHATTKMGPLELSGETEIKNKYSVDLFNYYGDELQYYFKRNNIRIVIFEDLDRFDSPLIFQKLRELNNNLNKSVSNITFIYSLKDKIFAVKGSETNPAALKTKFFDAVIPIFPIHSYRDSSKTFVNESRQYDLLTEDNYKKSGDYFKQRDNELAVKKAKNIKIDYRYLRGLGLYISDTREIKNIISETYFYFMELPLKMFDSEKGGSPNAINKLLAMIVYKNEFPKDFDNLASGRKSKLEDFINSVNAFKSALLNKETEDNNKQIDELNSKIESLRSKLTFDINTLMHIRFEELIDKTRRHLIMVGNKTYSENDNEDQIRQFWAEVLKNNLQYEDTYGYSYEADNVDQTEQKLFKLYLFENTIINKVLFELRTSKEKIESENDQLQKNISNLGIKDLLVNYLDNENSLSEKLSKEINKKIRFITLHPVLEYLIRQGLIEFDYTDYISPDPYNLNLSAIEENFVRDVNNHKSIKDPDYRLSRPERVVREIDLLDDSVNTFKYAYSPDILAYFSLKENEPKYREALIESSIQKNQPDFVLYAIDVLNSKNDGLSRLFHSISKIWPDYYTEIFESSNDNWKKDLSRQILNYLSNNNSSNELLNSLKKQKIFEDEIFENEFLFLKKDKTNKILRNKNVYLYPDLTFVKKYSTKKLSQFVSHHWFAENEVNFKIIFNTFSNHNLTNFLERYQNKLNLSNKFIKVYIFKYYLEEKNATYEDLESLVKFTQSDNENDNLSYYLKVLNVYLNIEVKFDNQTKEKLLIEDLHLVELIHKKQFKDTSLLSQLLKKDKLIYNSQVFDELYNNYQNIAKEYALQFESKENLADFYQHRTWNFIISYLESTKLINDWVKLIDRDADSNKHNMGWTQEKISAKTFQLLANNTLSANVMKSLMQMAKNTDDKTIILKNIFFKPQFEKQFTKQEISKLIFDDTNFIDSWLIDGRSEATTSELNEKYHRQLKQLYDIVPSTFKKRGSKGFIFLKNFNKWFKEN